MKKFCIMLPRNVEINIFNLPDDFESIVRETFAKFTEEIAADYRFCDKLAYIDRLIGRLTDNQYAEKCVDNLVTDRFEYEWKENGELLCEDDIYCREFMEDCFEAGKTSQKLYQHFGQDDHHIYDQIQKVIVQIIKIIINYEEEGGENE